MRRALEIADGRAFPLTDSAPYIGALFSYLLAAVFKLFGPSVMAPLILTVVLTSLTTIPAYLLGRELGGRLVGFVAGGLLATSAAHTIISSHVPWSHSLTPLLTTTTLWLLARTVNRREIGSLLLAGLCAGLALQTHPTAAPLLAGAALATLLQRSFSLRSRWPYLALGLLLVGYSTLLLSHVQTRFAVVDDVRGKQAEYLDADSDAGESLEHGVYANNLQQLLLSVARLSSGAIDEREDPSDYLRDPGVLAYGALALVGLLVVGCRRLLLPLSLLPAIFLPPVLNGKYEPILDGRYLMPLVPLLFVAIGLALRTGLDALEGRPLVGSARLAAALLAGWLVVHPLLSLARFYEESQEDGASNQVYLQTLQQLQDERIGQEPVVLDTALRLVKADGGGHAADTLTWLLAVSRVPTTTWRASDGPAPLACRLVVLHRDTVEEHGRSLRLERFDGRRPSGDDRQSYRAYRALGSGDCRAAS
jgi:4-amino-4-deoxy-L-arabinose transferase-like glycosyltransferase